MALKRSILGRISNVIPFRKAINCTVAGLYCKKNSEPQPMRTEHFKIENFDTVTFQLQKIEFFLFNFNLYDHFHLTPKKKIGQLGPGNWFSGKKNLKKGKK